MKKNFILIVDFGSQYTKLIAKKVEEIGIKYKLIIWNKIESNEILSIKPNGVILSGGPDSVRKLKKPDINKCIFEINVPILGICYGMQIMVKQLGGEVSRTGICEFGKSEVEVIRDSKITRNIYDYINSNNKPILKVWMSHQDQVTKIPNDFTNIARTENCKFTIIENKAKNYYGIQFHPEVSHTYLGINILQRFIVDICHCIKLNNKTDIINNIVKYIKNKVGNHKVLLGLSGGIDSSVTAILLNLAIGENLRCIFIDNGLLHTKNSKKMIKILKNKYRINTVLLSEKNRFFHALSGIIDPEEKRKIIGKTFIDIFQEQFSKINAKVKWLAQGTICADLIESSYFNSTSNIKSHHNVGGLPKNMKLNLIEPIKNFFKDEVKNIGLKLGLPRDILFQHPFPGPGFSIRIIGEVKELYCKIIKKADDIFIEELIKDKLYNKVSQAFSIFIPVKSVGIVGDKKKYKWIIALRAIESKNFLTAEWFKIPYSTLENISNRLTNEIGNISRVVYDISNKPPATIEWE